MRFSRRTLAALGAALVLSAAPAFAQEFGLETAPAPAVGEATPAATPRALELTRRYFAAMKMENTMMATVVAVMPQMMTRLARNNPNMTEAEKKAIVEAAAQSSQVMIVRMMDKMAPVFAQSFSERELQDLVNFYESPTGQALVAKTPAFAAKMNPTLNQLMPEMMADMQSRLCAKVACVAKAASAPRNPS
jgi:hypothetical protein